MEKLSIILMFLCFITVCEAQDINQIENGDFRDLGVGATNRNDSLKHNNKEIPKGLHKKTFGGI